jgi:hypothetical protein
MSPSSSSSSPTSAQYHVLRMYYCYILGKYRQALEVGQYASKILTYIGQFKKEVGMYTNTARVASHECV